MQLPSFLISSFSRRVDSFERIMNVALASCDWEMKCIVIEVGWLNICFVVVIYLQLNLEFIYLIRGRVQGLQFDLQGYNGIVSSIGRDKSQLTTLFW